MTSDGEGDRGDRKPGSSSSTNANSPLERESRRWPGGRDDGREAGPKLRTWTWVLQPPTVCSQGLFQGLRLVGSTGRRDGQSRLPFTATA